MNYEPPTLEVVGKLHEITKRGGGFSTDVPAGTPTNPIGDISSVTS